MSYARWGQEGSFVYVYESGDSIGTKIWVCFECRFAPETEETKFYRLWDLRTHLSRHAAEGDVVPKSTFERIDRELKGFF